VPGLSLILMRNASIFVLILVLALVAAACSDSGGSSKVASIDTGSADASEQLESDSIEQTETAMLAFTQCLRDQGIDVDDPTMDADGNMQLPPISFTSVVEGTDPEAPMPDIDAIIAPCEEHLAGIVTTAGPGDMTDAEDMFLAYAECMRSNGVDMPDPDFSSNGGVIDLGSDGGDGATFEAADKECRHLLADLGIGQ
jgi:hypothetical protein